MSGDAFPLGGLGAFGAAVFAGIYVLLSAFAHALEGLSAIRRKALVDESPERFARLMGETFPVARVAVRMTAQGAVLGGLLSLGSAFAASRVPEPWLGSAVAILLGWIVLEALVIRWVARRGADDVLRTFWWLIPLVLVFSAPLRPFLSRLVESQEEELPAPGTAPEAAPPTEAEREAQKADVRALLDVAREEGILEEHDEELLSRAVDFGARTVGEVMTARPDMVVAMADASLDEVADLFQTTKHTRIPLVDGDVEKPIGVVHVKDVFDVLRSPAPPATARPLAREVFFAPETQTIRTLLSDFKRRRQQLAIVVDEYGAVVGLATLEDLVEELVGEIADEHEEESDAVIALPGGGYSVNGRVRVAEIASLFDVSFPPAEYETVAGLVSERLGRIPRPGEKAEEAGLVFTVVEADRKKIHRVKVARVE